MVSVAERRIMKELAEMMDLKKDSSVPSVEMIDNNMCNLRGKVPGPPDTPYVNGNFEIEIIIPKESYPFSPPKCRFITRIWHPNISSVTGAICLDILKDNWGASMTIRTVLLSIQAMLAQPQPNDPQDAVVAKQFRENVDIFKTTARFWTQFYAIKEPIKEGNDLFSCEQKLRLVVDSCRVERTAALTVLSTCGWDVSAAKLSLSN